MCCSVFCWHTDKIFVIKKLFLNARVRHKGLGVQIQGDLEAVYTKYITISPIAYRTFIWIWKTVALLKIILFNSSVYYSTIWTLQHLYVNVRRFLFIIELIHSIVQWNSDSHIQIYNKSYSGLFSMHPKTVHKFNIIFF